MQGRKRVFRELWDAEGEEMFFLSFVCNRKEDFLYVKETGHMAQ